MQGQALRLGRVPGRDKGGPRFSRLRFVVGGLPGNMGNVDQHFAARALDFAARVLFVTQEVLLAMGTGKFEFTHNIQLEFQVVLLNKSPLTGRR